MEKIGEGPGVPTNPGSLWPVGGGCMVVGNVVSGRVRLGWMGPGGWLLKWRVAGNKTLMRQTARRRCQVRRLVLANEDALWAFASVVLKQRLSRYAAGCGAPFAHCTE